MREQRTGHPLVGCVHAAIQVERRDERLVDVFERRGKPTLVRPRLALAKDDAIGDALVIGDAREALARDERHLDAREPALVEVAILSEEIHGRDGAQDGIAQELEPLVVVERLLLVESGRMRDGRPEQRLVLEFVSENLLGLGYLVGMGLEDLLVGHIRALLPAYRHLPGQRRAFPAYPGESHRPSRARRCKWPAHCSSHAR